MKIYILALCVGLGNCFVLPDQLASSQLLTGTLLKQGETEQEALEGFRGDFGRTKVNMFRIKMI